MTCPAGDVQRIPTTVKKPFDRWAMTPSSKRHSFDRASGIHSTRQSASASRDENQPSITARVYFIEVLRCVFQHHIT